jgi:hypothetical protein
LADPAGTARLNHGEQVAHRLLLRLWYIAMNVGFGRLPFDRLFVPDREVPSPHHPIGAK